jgi:hypothetical protein
MEAFVRPGTNSDQLKLPYLTQMLQLQHMSSYLHFVNGMEQGLDIYLEHRSDSNFAKLSREIAALARRDHGFNLLGNGYYLCQGSTKGIDVDPSAHMLCDYTQFDLCYQPMIDE